jgi:MFS family permease
MLAAQLLALGLGLGLATLAFVGRLDAWLLLAITFALGVSQAIYLPAWQSSIGDMVPRETVPAAVALNAVSYNTCRALGPAIGGFLLIAWGAPAAFLFNALTTLGIVGVLVAWRRPRASGQEAREPFGAAIRIGFAYALFEPRLRSALIRSLMFSIFAASAYALLPVIGETLGTGARGYAALLTSFGLGAILAAVFSVGLRRRWGSAGLSTIGATATALALIVLGLVAGRAAMIAAMVVFGAGWVATFSTFNSSVQLLAPSWLVGRLIAIYQMTVFAGLAFGSAFWGMLADLTDLHSALAGAGVAMLLALLALRGRAVLAEASLQPQGSRAYTPNPPALPIAADDGPIVFEIGYEVDPDNVPAFVAAIRELGALRRIEGVRRWRLRRDIDAPNRWVESFWITNWAEQQGRALHLSAESEAAREKVARFAVPETRRVSRYLVIPDKRGVQA